jgi:hypothetical protein
MGYAEPDISDLRTDNDRDPIQRKLYGRPVEFRRQPGDWHLSKSRPRGSRQRDYTARQFQFRFHGYREFFSASRGCRHGVLQRRIEAGDFHGNQSHLLHFGPFRARAGAGILCVFFLGIFSSAEVVILPAEPIGTRCSWNL